MNVFTAIFSVGTPAPAFHPSLPLAVRKVLWWFRNPAETFMAEYVGIKGKPFTTTGKHGNVTWNPQGGFNLLVHHLNGRAYLFVSYRGKVVEFYLGWRPSGTLGAAFRHANAKGY